MKIDTKLLCPEKRIIRNAKMEKGSEKEGKGESESESKKNNINFRVQSMWMILCIDYTMLC